MSRKLASVTISRLLASAAEASRLLGLLCSGTTMLRSRPLEVGAPLLAAARRKAVAKSAGGAGAATFSGGLLRSASRARLGRLVATMRGERDPAAQPRPCGAVCTTWADGAKAWTTAGRRKRALDIALRWVRAWPGVLECSKMVEDDEAFKLVFEPWFEQKSNDLNFSSGGSGKKDGHARRVAKRTKARG